MTSDGPLRRCGYCGEVLGIYETLVVLVDGRPAATTSLAALGEPREGVLLVHSACHQADSEDEPPGPAAA